MRTFVDRLRLSNRSAAIMPKRTASQPEDPYEREAEGTAERVLRMPTQRIPAFPERGEELQRQSPWTSHPAVHAPGTDLACTEALRGGGVQLPASVRSFFEPRFGADFGDVRVHAGRRASEVAAALHARAFVFGRNLVFGAGEYAPATQAGRRLLAHELAHVVQQRAASPARRATPFTPALPSVGKPVLMRQPVANEPAKRRIDYRKAETRNKRYAERLGWAARLDEVRPEWAILWSSDNFNAFADAVAAFQVLQGFKRDQVDGVLGPKTWDRLRPIGEVVAEQRVSWTKSSEVCSIAAQERITKGYQRATGEPLVSKEEKSDFRIILHSIESKLLEVDEEYRGTGAAGALVYLGAGEFVSQSDIWDKKLLKPGAAMQVWRKASDLDRLKKGEEPESTGTAFVFVRYEGEDAMRVLHFNREETQEKGSYEVWIAANLTPRSAVAGGAEESAEEE